VKAGRTFRMRLGLRFRISLDWKRMRDEVHSLKTA